MTFQTYRCPEPFLTEQEGTIGQLDIAYHTWGKLNENRDNVVWVCHALTADSDVDSWWPGTIGPGLFLDPNKWFIVCANIPGSCYGSTGPLSINPATREPYYGDFPPLTIRDIVSSLKLLAGHLGIDRIHCLVGSSVGGFQALEWAADEPWRFDSAIFIATAPEASPWAIAIDETQRMAIKSDGTWGERRSDAGAAGMAAARALGLLTYRGPEGYNLTQRDKEWNEPAPAHRACSYQQYQGEKLRRRFNAYSYVSILDAFDTHNIGRDRGGVKKALSRIKCPTICLGITTDIIFPPSEMKGLTSMLPDSEYAEIESAFGHDGFLVENERLNQILTPFINR